MTTPNPKCTYCRSYWVPDESDVKSSGLVCKMCKRCRELSKAKAQARKCEHDKMPDYNNGKIYTIKHRIDESLVYVGSTCQELCDRMCKHRSSSKQDKCKNTLFYKTVADNGGWPAFYIELYETYPCNNREELTGREGEVIRQTGTLNTQIAGRTIKEWFQDNKEDVSKKKKDYYLANTEDISQRHKAYYLANADALKEYAKIYRNDNADIISQKQMEWYQANNEDVLRKQKAYQQANVVAISQRKKAYYQANKQKWDAYNRQRRAKKKAEAQQAKQTIVV